MGVLETKNLSYVYGVGTPFRMDAITDINLKIEKGERIGIIGHPGSGKSTLVQHFNGLLKPESGQVLLDGADIWENPKQIRKIRFQVGLVFQYPEHQLFDETVYKDIAFGPKNMGLSEAEIRERVGEAVEIVGLSKKLLEKSPFDLSGGEKRRAAIAGVIAMKPSVLVLDEPTAGLDPKGRDSILYNLKKYQEKVGTTMLLVSHSMEDVAKFARRVLVMNKGQVAMFDTVPKVFERADELSGMGLNIPQITQVFIGLKKRGVPVKANVYTLEQAVTELEKLKGGGVSGA